MINETSPKNEIFTAIESAVSELTALVSTLDENEFNDLPYENSWSAAQLLQHLIKSTNAMAQAEATASTPVDRNPGENISHKQNISRFLQQNELSRIHCARYRSI
jgi:hypothetical protein